MPARRLLFVRPQRRLRPIAVYLALLTLALLSALELTFAFWPTSPSASDYVPPHNDAEPAGGPSTGGQHVAPPARRDREQGTWM